MAWIRVYGEQRWWVRASWKQVRAWVHAAHYTTKWKQNRKCYLRVSDEDAQGVIALCISWGLEARFADD